MKTLNYVIVAAVLASCNNDAEKETFYLPEGYNGTIAIVFDQKHGQAKEYKDGRRIYRIPSNGVLYTQLPDVRGVLNRKYYYINSSGETSEEIPSLALPILSVDKYDSSRVYVMDGFDGKFGDTEFIYLCVGKASESDSLIGIAGKLMDQVREKYPEQIK